MKRPCVTIKLVRKKLLILAAALLLFGVRPVFAASVEAPTSIQSEIQIDQSFSINSNLTSVQSGEVYFVKCRTGPSSSSLTEGQTYNSATTNWLFDTDSWTDMPTVTATGSTTSFSLQCKMKSSATEGQKTIYTRACLKKSDGTCGTSFQSSSGTSFTAIAPVSTPTPVPTTDPSPTSTSTSTSSTQSSSFTISDIPSQINSDQSFSIKVSLSMPSSANTDYYLKGAFKKSDGTRYLGLTKKDADWIEYGDDYSDQYKITTDSSGNWSGQFEVKPDTLDNDYKGSGDYIFKVGRYTAGGSGPTWSNEVTVKINDLSSSSPSSSATAQPTTKTNSSSSASLTSSKSSTPKPILKIASIAGVTSSSTPEPTVEIKSQKQTNPFVWMGAIFIFAGAGAVVYIYLKANGKIPFKFRG